MKKMYRVETNTYTDCEGRYTDRRQVGEYVATEAEARVIAETVEHNNWDTGDWYIIARTIDEASFTVVDEEVASFNYYREIVRKKMFH